MKRIIVDYSKLTNEILNLLVDRFPDGYDDSNIIRFRNAHNELVEAVEVRTEDTIYLVKVSTKLANRLEKFEDEDIEEARNAISDFSSKAFKLAKVKVTQKMTLSEKEFVLVQEFQTAKIAGEYINAYKAGFEYLDDFQNNKIYIINQENLKKLIETSKFEDYKTFYFDNY